jgi:hypothetical protein
MAVAPLGHTGRRSLREREEPLVKPAATGPPGALGHKQEPGRFDDSASRITGSWRLAQAISEQAGARQRPGSASRALLKSRMPGSERKMEKTVAGHTAVRRLGLHCTRVRLNLSTRLLVS